ncbi:hypothetical protein EHR01_12360 [Leptospira mtsangambouensis]|uniref:Uncharacterized protein n=1 Tax=Leptospira mtsangambouensis TaxID=2484912 RepID=A0ABY2NZ56_9LEPT|nr:hypothetical protein EHR01_12360 [Leptospira mtsangambouensis]
MSLLLLAQASCQSLTSHPGLRAQPTSVSLIRYAKISGRFNLIKLQASVLAGKDKKLLLPIREQALLGL